MFGLFGIGDGSITENTVYQNQTDKKYGRDTDKSDETEVYKNLARSDDESSKSRSCRQVGK